MGKIIANVNITLDGIFTGPAGDEGNIVSWAMPGIVDSSDDDLEMFQKVEAILMGRVTYEGFSKFWPFQSGAWADAMNKTKKFVVSNNCDLAEVHWGDYDNTITLLNADAMDRVAQLKKEIQGNIIVSASGNLVQSLVNAELLDEMQLLINPVILGSGKRYLDNIKKRHDMKLVFTKIYENSGAVLLRYAFTH